MRILITGADGVLGSNLVRELLSRDYEITTLLERGKKSTTLDGLVIEKIEGDILQLDEVEAAMKGKDVVIHCAASTSVWPSRSDKVCQVNIEGTRNIIDACLSNDIQRLIYVGTANSFGFGAIDKPGDECNPYRADKYGLDYMDSKFIAQQCVLTAVQEKGLPAVIVNPTFMLGAYDSTPSSGTMILAVAEGKVPGYTPGGKNYINVQDVAVAISNAIELGTIGECYILGNENLSYKDAFKKIASVVGGKIPERKVPGFFVKTYGMVSTILANLFRFRPACSYRMSKVACDDHFYSANKAIRELKLPQTPIELGIHECFEWFKANGYYTK